MSSHVGEAAAFPSPPEGLDKRQERYWLIERRCKDLCLYLDVIPIGASTSQIMANMALNPLDHFARRELRLTTYLRYCDDMIALFETAEQAHAAHQAMAAKVAELGMSLNSKSGVGWIDDGVDWVGYRHWRTYKLIRKRSLKRLKRKANGCSLETTMAYLSHAKDTASLRHVARLLWRGNPEHIPEIYSWMKSHAR